MGKYDDIIGLPHCRPKNHPHMPVADRAAQFAPFAALTGYDDAISRASRITGGRVEPGEDRLAELDFMLAAVASRIDQRPLVTVTYFVSDRSAEGGEYVTVSAPLLKIDQRAGALIFADGLRVSLADVISLS